jgi:hypothetical protein
MNWREFVVSLVAVTLAAVLLGAVLREPLASLLP